MKKNGDDSTYKLTFWQRVKIKFLMLSLKITGKDTDYKSFKKRLNATKDITPSMGASSFGLYGLPDFEYGVVYSQLKIDKKYRYIWIDSINGGISYEGGGILYIHNNFKGTIYAPNSCIYIRKTVNGLIEAENSKILVRENNCGYIHSPKGEILIGGANYGYIYTRSGFFSVLGYDSGITRGDEKTLKQSQIDLLLGLKKD